MPPEKIGRYEIRTELGRGGMSTVFLAYDPNMDRQIALKMLPREFLHSNEFRERFNREAKIIAALEHPAIVPIYDFGEQEGQPYFVMRYMSGGSLADRLRDGPLALDEALSILERIGSALDYAHSRGIIHRDLKPANILFDRFGKAYLGDFGIARLQETGATLTGTVFLGTPAYMSPEQVEAIGELTGRADIYALGVILFEVLTGQKPYHAETPAGLALKHLTEPVPSVLASRPDLPPDVERVIDRAMAKKPEDRYPTAVELTSEITYVMGGKALAGAAAEANAAAAPTTVMPADATTASRPPGTVASSTGGTAATSTGGAAAVPTQPARRIPIPVIVGGLVILAVACLAAAVFLIGGNNGLFGGAAATDTPTATATLAQTATTAPTDTATATTAPTHTPTATQTVQPTQTFEPSPTAAATEPGPTPTLRPTNSPAPTQVRPTNTPVRVPPTATSPPPPPATSPPQATSPPPPPPPPPTSPPQPPPPTIAPP